MISVLKFKKYRLLYKATRDGDSANKFHSMCDNYNNLIANSSEYEPDLFLPVKVLINYRKSQMWHDDISSIPSCPLVQCSTVIRFLVRFCICKNYS